LMERGAGPVEPMGSRTMRDDTLHEWEGRTWENVDGKVRCLVCPRKCVISDGERGFCRVRENRDGELVLLIHGRVSTAVPDPIEKKPLFHYKPGTNVFSLGTVGCNFRCRHCQNWQISQARPEEVPLEEWPPERIVKAARRTGCESVAFTYNEPIIGLEYTVETFEACREEGLGCVYVTNGFATKRTAKMLGEVLDAANVDLKAFTEEFYRDVAEAWLEPVLRTCEVWKDMGVHVELTTLVIPGYNDSEEEAREIARWIRKELGPDTPWHVSRFHPDYKMLDVPPTPVETIEKFVEIGYEEGLYYVYAGNVPGHRYENTYCPECKRPVVIRRGFSVVEMHLTDDFHCKHCDAKLHFVA
ncbi:AmmeMemoRadiSam system radical SAM enzyme, partial [Methanopyrus sp.]